MRYSRVGAVALAAGMLAAIPAWAQQSGGYQWEAQNQNQAAQQGNQRTWEQEEARQRAAQQNREYYTDQYGNRQPQREWTNDRPRYDVRERRDVRDIDNERPFGERVRNMFNDEDDRNPFGVGDDIFDDKWDTGLDDMGEYNAWDYPAEYRRDLQALREGRFHTQYGVRDPHNRAQRGLRDDDVWDGRQPWYNRDSNNNRTTTNERTVARDRTVATNRDDRNPFGVGNDVFDDKWDTGGDDMGEYNAWDYPAEYRRDLQALREGRFHTQYGVRDPHNRAQRGLRDDDVWDGRQPAYNDNDRVTTRDRDKRDLWDRVDRPMGREADRREGMLERDRVRVPLGTTEDVRGMDRDNRRLHLGDATPNQNPYGVGDDVFDDKWDTGLWDMGEYNAWDHPQEYQRDVQMLDRGQFNQRYGVSPDEDRERARKGLRDDDIWDGRQPWYRDNDDTYRTRDNRVIRRDSNRPIYREW
jgi:hypothetical protein